MDYFLGSLMLVPYSFAPTNYALCQGQQVSIASNSALFSLLGTMYGGNGTTYFNLPDLQGRVPLSNGQGPGLPAYNQGQQGGAENVTLLSTQIPAHNHQVPASNDPAATGSVNNATWAQTTDQGSGNPTIYGSATNGVMDPKVVSITGGSQGHPNMMPYLVLNWIICTAGIFPPRPS